jgi:LuxR family transcriptional regulator, activator of tox operons
MQVQPLKRSVHSTDPLHRNIGRLIGTVGTAAFEQSLFDAAQAATRCSHLTAFVSGPKTVPRPLVAVNAGPRNLARSLAERYIGRYWHLDPANDFAGSGDLPDGGAALRIGSGDIASARYRSECYTDVDLGERFSLLRRSRDSLIRVNFYVSRRDEAFDEPAVRNILDSADLLMALLTRHESAGVAPAAQCNTSFIERLRLLRPTLTRRELQVCDGIARGLTSTGIALEMGVTLNTVLTHRKHAYARLGISSQNELLRCVLA